jgi:hypothetical protein
MEEEAKILGQGIEVIFGPGRQVEGGGELRRRRRLGEMSIENFQEIGERQVFVQFADGQDQLEMLIKKPPVIRPHYSSPLKEITILRPGLTRCREKMAIKINVAVSRYNLRRAEQGGGSRRGYKGGKTGKKPAGDGEAVF